MEKYFVPCHEDKDETPYYLRVNAFRRFFRPDDEETPSDDSEDTSSVRTIDDRFYPRGAVCLTLESLVDFAGRPLTVRLSPEHARYLAGALFRLADQIEDPEHTAFGSSYDVDF